MAWIPAPPQVVSFGARVCENGAGSQPLSVAQRKGERMFGSMLALLRQRRCFCLLIAMVLLLFAIAFMGQSRGGRLLVGVFNLVMLIAAVAAVARTRAHTCLMVVLGLPVIGLQLRALHSLEPTQTAEFYAAAAVFYLVAIVELMQYVLRREQITADKLYGAVAVYIMLAILWALFYGVLEYVYTGSFAAGGTPRRLDFAELVYFSFAVLTTSGFGDITPQLMPARFVAIFEQIVGVMYVAILIARLTGVYPIRHRDD